MAGVLFVVCIPRENFEKCLSNRRQSSEEDENYEAKNNMYESFSSISMQGSSVGSNSSKPIIEKAESSEIEAIKEAEKVGDGTQKDVRFKRPPEMRGSMDSDVFIRTMERENREKENQEAVEKFFNMSAVDNLSKNKTMECVMREIIDRMEIRNVSWQKVNNGNSYKISFSLEKGVRCDDTIHLLSEYGIGQKKGSSCVIIPCSVYKDKSHLKKADKNSSEEPRETSWNRHIGNVRARLNVEKLVHAVKSDATLSFDFIVLLIAASVVASFGLVENSMLILTASMLISPLMGPILAATFGKIIKDRQLQFWGIWNELIGIILCIVVGFFFGIIIYVLHHIFNFEIELTGEMLSRCKLRSVIVGVFVALLSGAAQAIALLRENFGSLVGVAISASLLPPAVNTGLMWSFLCANQMFQVLDIKAFSSIEIKDPAFSENPAMELLVLGALSLCLTIINVICVYFMGYVFLCIKIEVAPLSTEEERQFWKHDVPIARDYNKTLNAEDGKRLKEQLDEYRESETENFRGVAAELLKQNLYPQTHTWSPLMQKFSSKADQERPSVINFNAYYKSMTAKTAGEHHNKSQQNKSFFSKHSEPIPTPNASTSSAHQNPESLSEPIRRHTTFVDIESSSNEDDKGHRKFFVTPAKEDFM